MNPQNACLRYSIIDSYLGDIILWWVHERYIAISDFPKFPDESVVKEIETKMKDSPLAYRFQPLRSAFADHESLPLKLLGVAARGIARANGLIVLRPKSFSAATTLFDLVTNKTTFAATSCLDSDTNRWMMNLGEIIFYVSLVQSLIQYTFSCYSISSLTSSQWVSPYLYQLLASQKFLG
jgi:hypothetical protein